MRHKTQIRPPKQKTKFQQAGLEDPTSTVDEVAGRAVGVVWMGMMIVALPPRFPARAVGVIRNQKRGTFGVRVPECVSLS